MVAKQARSHPLCEARVSVTASRANNALAEHASARAHQNSYAVIASTTETASRLVSVH
jgi:hypothetical protein